MIMSSQQISINFIRFYATAFIIRVVVVVSSFDCCSKCNSKCLLLSLESKHVSYSLKNSKQQQQQQKNI